MKESARGSESTTNLPVVKLLVEVSHSDPVYADLYFLRARELLGNVLSQAQYNALKGNQRETDAAVKQMKDATASQDWKRVESLAQQVDQLRRFATENAEA